MSAVDRILNLKDITEDDVKKMARSQISCLSDLALMEIVSCSAEHDKKHRRAVAMRAFRLLSAEASGRSQEA